MEALLASFKRPPRYGMWYHVLETLLPSGKSRVLATLCSRKSADQLVVTLQNSRESNQSVVYSIDPTPISEPLRRCDKCMC
jgi:hypothetical protein